MVTVKCEKTGIEFEAATKRTKNHPAIMALLNEAAKDEWYGYAVQALKDGKELGYSTIEEYIEALNAAKDQSNEAYKRLMTQKRAEKEARRERYILNSRLASHGYTWQNIGIDAEEVNTAVAPVGDAWILVAQDGRTVTVAQALAEMEAK